MPLFGPVVAVIRNGQVLLQLREDVQLWNLPGGAVEPGESLVEAAVREVREETGLQVRLTRLVGVYSRPKWRDGGAHSMLFAAAPVGGDLVTSTDETLDAGFFDPAKLPHPFFGWHRRMIADALAGTGGSVVWTQNVSWPAGMDRQEVVARTRRDRLFAEELVATFTRPPGPDDERLEVSDEA